jgi:chemotaxis protein MotB
VARGRRGGGRRRRGGGEGEKDGSERWLLTYSDMITLLMALFIVMFAMSSVNTTKFESLQQALSQAFSGRILGGEAIKETGGQGAVSTPAMNAQQTMIQPLTAVSAGAQHEQEDFRRLKARIDAVIAKEGLQRKVQSAIDKRGLAVRVLTDGLLFDSGSADVKPGAAPLLSKLARVLATDKAHPFRIEGHTDDVPVAGLYPSNWELSTARSSAVVRSFMSDGLSARRFEAVGRAELDPLKPNTTEAGRAANRRVEIILPRKHAEPSPATPREAVAAAVTPQIPSDAREGTR